MRSCRGGPHSHSSILSIGPYGRTSLGTWGLPRVAHRWLVFFLSRGDHEDDRPLLLARPRKLARVDLPDDHAEAVQREKDVVELVAAQVTPKNKAYALTQDEAGRVHHLYTSATRRPRTPAP